MKSLIIGVVLASVAAFMWGAFFWMGPITANAFQTQQDDTELRNTLRKQLPATGTYFVPNPNMNMDTYEKLHEEGGIAMIHYVKEGRSSDMGGVMFMGFMLNLVTSLGLALLLKMAASKLGTYGKRVVFIALIGFVAALFVNVNNAVWWYHAAGWTFLLFLYDFGIYLTSGLVLAAFIKSS